MVHYWNIGPQGTMYIPGEFLKEKNTLQILELHKPADGEKVTFIDYPKLDMIESTQKLETRLFDKIRRLLILGGHLE